MILIFFYFNFIYLAPSEKKRLAPSTIYLNLGVPSLLNILWTFVRFTDSGLPPHGTKKSPQTSSFKWKLFLKFNPLSTIYPLGKVLLLSLIKTIYPFSDNLPLKLEIILLYLAKISNYSLSIPKGSNKTPLPSTIPTIFS